MKKLNDKDYELIKKHYDWELEEDEREQFEQRMESSIDFQQEVASFKMSMKIVDKLFDPELEQRKQAFKEKLQQLPKIEETPIIKIIPHSSFKIKKLYKPIAIAASIALLLGIALTWWLPNNATKDALAISLEYAQNINTDALYAVVKSGNQTDQPTIYKTILTAFKNKNYQEVIQLAQNIPSSSDAYGTVLLLKGRSLNALGNTSQAIATFEEAIARNIIEKDIAMWSIVANCLAQEPPNKIDAKYYLEQIIAEDFPSKEDALTILKDFN